MKFKLYTSIFINEEIKTFQSRKIPRGTLYTYTGRNTSRSPPIPITHIQVPGKLDMMLLFALTKSLIETFAQCQI